MNCYSDYFLNLNNMDNLEIIGLSVATKIGIHPWEKRIIQRLSINMLIPYDCSNCEDDIEQTIDYAKLSELVTTFVESNSFNLIETVANQVANLIKTAFNLEKVTVSVSKQHAVKNASDVRVMVTR